MGKVPRERDELDLTLALIGVLLLRGISRMVEVDELVDEL
jgi:hypothetical protein